MTEEEGALDGYAVGLLQVNDEFAFLHLCAAEAEQLYTEVFVEAAYMQPPIVLREGAYVVDVGACYGLFGMMCMSRCHVAGLLAIEPVPPLHALLMKNIAMFSAAAVSEDTVIETAQVALGGLDGDTEPAGTTITFFPEAPGESTCHPDERRQIQEATVAACLELRGPGNVAAAKLGLSEDDVLGLQERAERLRDDGLPRQYTVRAASLSALLEPLAWPRVDLLKIDCEGEELSVLLGICDHHWDLIRQVRPAVHDWLAPERLCVCASAPAYGSLCARVCNCVRGSSANVATPPATRGHTAHPPRGHIPHSVPSCGHIPHLTLHLKVVMEVHDVRGRLDAVCALLTQRGFDITVRGQASRVLAEDYVMFTPRALRMYYVYAVKDPAA